MAPRSTASTAAAAQSTLSLPPLLPPPSSLVESNCNSGGGMGSMGMMGQWSRTVYPAATATSFGSHFRYVVHRLRDLFGLLLSRILRDKITCTGVSSIPLLARLRLFFTCGGAGP